MSNLLRPCPLKGTAPFQSAQRASNPSTVLCSSSQNIQPPNPSCTSKAPSTIDTCSQPNQQFTRRDALLLTSPLVLTSLAQLAACAASASASDISQESSSASTSNSSASSDASSRSTRGLSRYVRKKKLDALDSYVPLVLEARQQLEQSGELAVADAAGARQLLRVGPFSGLRDNVRALGEYAVQNGKQPDSSTLVNAFFRSLDSYDLVLYQAIRDKTEVDKAAASGKLKDALQSMDNLIATVPADILEKSKAVLAVTAAKSAAAGTETKTPGWLEDETLF